MNPWALQIWAVLLRSAIPDSFFGVLFFLPFLRQSPHLHIYTLLFLPNRQGEAILAPRAGVCAVHDMSHDRKVTELMGWHCVWASWCCSIITYMSVSRLIMWMVTVNGYGEWLLWRVSVGCSVRVSNRPSGNRFVLLSAARFTDCSSTAKCPRPGCLLWC